MRKRVKRFAAWLAIGVACAAGPSARGEETNAMQSTINGNTAFAFDLYGRLRGGTGNLFFSPYSISTCLAMTYAGARGETAGQMARVFHFDADASRLCADFHDLQQGLAQAQSNGAIQLNVANGLWAQQGHPFLPDYLGLARDQFGANIRQADFRTAAEAARTEINDWVQKETRDKIKDFFSEGALGPTTRLVLANAIYFKGKWQTQFRPDRTSDAPFHGGGTPATAHLMNQTVEYGYAEPEGLQVLEMPYQGNSISMVVLLPRDAGGLPSLEAGLTAEQLQQWVGALHWRKVNVFFPRFKLETRFELNSPLAAMGMTDAFTTRANFSGLDGRRDLLISIVLHKAFVEVNEEGTEAAAATGVGIRAMAVVQPEPIPTFRADHPFIFLIRDKTSGSILFLGRVTDPGR